MNKRRVGILISGRGSNMEALIAAAAAKDYPAKIAVVISNRPQAAGLKQAAALGVATGLVDHEAYGNDRQAFERALLAELAPHNVELICLAGFMRVLSGLFVSRWPQRLLNIHPALLPAFPGRNTHARALAAGVKLHGATVHMVSAEVDAGPIIAQAALGVHEEDTAETLAERVLVLEHRLYPHALKLMASGRVRLEDGRCRIEGACLPEAPLFVPKL